MELADWIGFLGVFQILVAYLFNISGVFITADFSFRILNFSGATMACIASVLINYWPFIVLEGIWSIISFKYLISHQSKNAIHHD